MLPPITTAWPQGVRLGYDDIRLATGLDVPEGTQEDARNLWEQVTDWFSRLFG